MRNIKRHLGKAAKRNGYICGETKKRNKESQETEMTEA